MSFYRIISTLKDKRRSIFKAKLLGDFIDNRETVLDIGTGSGSFANYLMKNGFDVSTVDVVDKTTHSQINPIIYNGRDLPFKDQSFEASMLITILHHCQDPDRVFAEAVRVSKRKLIVLEDVYSNGIMKRLTWWMDSLVNLEFKGHPHTNKSEAEWEKLFDHHQLKIKKKTKTRVLVFFTQVMYHLEKL